jgi:hypothetical protein
MPKRVELGEVERSGCESEWPALGQLHFAAQRSSRRLVSGTQSPVESAAATPRVLTMADGAIVSMEVL